MHSLTGWLFLMVFTIHMHTYSIYSHYKNTCVHKEEIKQTHLFSFKKITACLDKGNTVVFTFWTSTKHLIWCLFKNYYWVGKELERLTDWLIRKCRAETVRRFPWDSVAGIILSQVFTECYSKSCRSFIMKYKRQNLQQIKPQWATEGITHEDMNNRNINILSTRQCIQ